MIEVDLRGEVPKALGLVPGQVIILHMANGDTWRISRFGADCTAKKEEKKK